MTLATAAPTAAGRATTVGERKDHSAVGNNDTNKDDGSMAIALDNKNGISNDDSVCTLHQDVTALTSRCRCNCSTAETATTATTAKATRTTETTATATAAYWMHFFDSN